MAVSPECHAANLRFPSTNLVVVFLGDHWKVDAFLLSANSTELVEIAGEAIKLPDCPNQAAVAAVDNALGRSEHNESGESSVKSATLGSLADSGSGGVKRPKMAIRNKIGGSPVPLRQSGAKEWGAI
jgi:hypothetical protein